MTEPECTHRWRTCPLHNPDEGLPPLVAIVTCIYGGMTTVDGDPWGEHDSREVVERVSRRLFG